MSHGNKPLLVENGVIVGTASDKYETKNPLARCLVRGYDNNVVELARLANPEKILEIGCGEGHVTKLLEMHTHAEIRATELSKTVLEIAKKEVISERVTFEQKNVFEFHRSEPKVDLVVCCEVLEHLEEPGEALRILHGITKNRAILSVPREPLWRILNVFRRKYWSDFGNTPGHIQAWSQRGFVQFVSRFFHVEELRAPIPWTMLLCRPKKIT